jgi:riboflavin synthase
MFTGIIEETGKVTAIRTGAASVRLTVEATRVLGGTRTGDSICTDGVCLTVTQLAAGRFSSDVIPETLRKTTLGDLKPGSRVNLERALSLSDRLGGHLLTGHIDGTGRIIRRWSEDNALWFAISAGQELLRYLVLKGSVAVDGISLTVAGTGSSDFTVSLIPHTQSETTLPEKQPGTLVNIECDILGKYIEKLVTDGNSRPGITLESLARKGFL